MKTFDTVAKMKTAYLADGQIVNTRAYDAAGQGFSSYDVLTAAQYGGTPDEAGDHTLVNGNIAKLRFKNYVAPEQFGAAGDGTTDDAAAFQAAIDYMFALGGGTVKPYSTNSWVIDSAIQIKEQVSLVRTGLPPQRRDWGSVKPTDNGIFWQGLFAVINLEEGASIQGFTCINRTLIWPVVDTNEYASTGIVVLGFDGGPNPAADTQIRDMIILGFNQAIDNSSDNTERMWMRTIKFDCLNGIKVDRSQDISYITECTGWPFLTIGTGVPEKYFRAGIAFEIIGAADWIILERCFAFHYTKGFSFDGINTATATDCSYDSVTTDVTNPDRTGFFATGDVFRLKWEGCKSVATIPFRHSTTVVTAAAHPTMIYDCQTWGAGDRAVLIEDGDVDIRGGVFSAKTNGVVRSANAGVVHVDGVTFKDITNAAIQNFAGVADTKGFRIGPNNRYIDSAPFVGGSDAYFPEELTAATTLDLTNKFHTYMTVVGSTAITGIEATAGVGVAPVGVPFTLGFQTAGASVTSTNNITLAGGATFTATNSFSTLTLVFDGIKYAETSRSANST